VSLKDILSTDIGRAKRRRVGRGLGSGLGKTGGRGQKGEGSRTGGKNRGPMFEGGQFPFWMRLPRRGFSNFVHANRFRTVRLDIVLKLVEGGVIDAGKLVDAGLVRPGEAIKLVGGRGEAAALDRKLAVTLDRVSAPVRKAIEAAGGTVTETAAATGGEAAG
jgi:large subunit ribosomal protein L15